MSLAKLIEIASRPADRKSVVAARRVVIKRLSRMFNVDDHRKLNRIVPQKWLDEFNRE